mmetsp:Transcript_69917/g.193333  ORF Transcript_69917/g.193333 Transcript_69917/m.193333 type:complete len:240 (-) Transcript_69917:667-1386(-)
MHRPNVALARGHRLPARGVQDRALEFVVHEVLGGRDVTLRAAPADNDGALRAGPEVGRHRHSPQWTVCLVGRHGVRILGGDVHSSDCSIMRGREEGGTVGCDVQGRHRPSVQLDGLEQRARLLRKPNAHVAVVVGGEDLSLGTPAPLQSVCLCRQVVQLQEVFDPAPGRHAPDSDHRRLGQELVRGTRKALARALVEGAPAQDLDDASVLQGRHRLNHGAGLVQLGVPLPEDQVAVSTA